MVSASTAEPGFSFGLGFGFGFGFGFSFGIRIQDAAGFEEEDSRSVVTQRVDGKDIGERVSRGPAKGRRNV